MTNAELVGSRADPSKWRITVGVVSSEQVARAKESARKREIEAEFWLSHRDELFAKYPHELVVVQGGEVIASGRDGLKVMLELEARGVDVRETWMGVVRSNGRISAL